MDEQNVLLAPNSENTQPKKDLDDIIFHGEWWFTSDR